MRRRPDCMLGCVDKSHVTTRISEIWREILERGQKHTKDMHVVARMSALRVGVWGGGESRNVSIGPATRCDEMGHFAAIL